MGKGELLALLAIYTLKEVIEDFNKKIKRKMNEYNFPVN
jgi:hypothetical protein